MKLAHRSRALLTRFRENRSGNVAIIFAFSLPLLAGSGAFGLETGVWYYEQLKLQQAADAAAYAGGVDRRAGKDDATVLAGAKKASQQNGVDPDAATDSMTVHTPPTSGTHQNANSVEVILARTETRFFSQLFDTSPVIVRARAVSTYVTASNACILALDAGASRALEFTGSSTVNLNSCNAMANSIATDAVYAQGATTVYVPCLMSGGGASINAGVHMSACTTAMTNLPPVADPYAGLPAPTVDPNCKTLGNNTPNSIGPDTYCGLTLNGTVSLKPGVYVVDGKNGGSLSTNGSANISGTGVTFYLVNGASIKINGNSTLNVSAPTTGTYSGVLFFGGRSNSAGGDVTMNGTATSSMTGVIYFPAQKVYYTGNFHGANGCTQVVAKTIAWSGNSSLGINCSAAGMKPLVVGGVVKLAE